MNYSSVPTLKENMLASSSAGLESQLICGDQGKLCVNSTNLLKVKRRKTKKERNSIKFKKQKETFQKKTWVQDYPKKHGGYSFSHDLKTAPQSSGKTFMSKQVFITQDRLTQHQGIFDHEVKSVNIERFVRETTEVANTGTDTATNQSERRSPESQMDLSLCIIPTAEEKDQDDYTLKQKNIHNVGSRAAETQTEISQLNPNSQERNSTSCIQCSGSHVQSTISVSSRSGASPEKIQEIPVHEAAESINNMLSLRNIFPGRNLVRELRHSLLEKVKTCGINSRLSTLVHRNPDYEAESSAKSLWEHASEERTGNRKSVWRPHGFMESTPIRFMPVLRDSPSLLSLNLVRPEEDQQILSPILHQSLRVESRYEPSLQHRQKLAENSLTVQLPNESFQTGKHNKDALFHCRGSRRRSNHSLSVNVESPQVKFTFDHDDLKNTHEDQKNIKQHKNQRMEYLIPGQCMQDIFLDQPGPSVPRGKTRENRSSFDFLHNLVSDNVHKSPVTKIFGVSPIEYGDCYTGVSFFEAESKKHDPNNYNIFDVNQRPTLNRLHHEDPLTHRNVEHLSLPMEADMNADHDIFYIKPLEKFRNRHISRDCAMWNSPFSLREATGVMGNCDTEFHKGGSCSHKTSHQCNKWRKMPTTSTEDENSFVARAVRRELAYKPSPETWVYPRMKLY